MNLRQLHSKLTWTQIWIAGIIISSMTIVLFGVVKNLTTDEKWEKTLEISHDGLVYEVAWSPDEMKIATGSSDGSVKIWNIEGDLLQTINQASGDSNVRDIVWSADNKHILVTFYKEVKLWDIDGTLVFTLHHDDMVFGAIWNANETRILTYSRDETAKLWSDSGELMAVFQHSAAVVAEWSTDENHILTRSIDGTVTIWDTVGNILYTAKHSDDVDNVIWNEDETISLIEVNNRVEAWSIDGELLFTLTHDNRVYGARWNHDETRILTWSADDTAKLWDSKGNLLATLDHTDDGENVDDALWNEDETHILTYSQYPGTTCSPCNTARVWDSNGKLVTTLTLEPFGMVEARWNQDGMQILAWSNFATIKKWSLSGRELDTIYTDSAIGRVFWSNDEHHILVVTQNDTVQLWALN